MKLLSVLFLLILLICAFLTSAARMCAESESENISNETKQQQNSGTNKEIAEPELLAPIEQVPISAGNTDHGNQPKGYWQKIICEDKLPNWLTVGGWIIAAILAAFTVKFLRDQVAANIESANAATRANEIATTTLEMSRRARISIKDVKFVERRALPTIEYILVNTGELPATGVFRYPMRSEMEPRLLDHAHPPNPVGAGEIIDPHSEAKHSWRLTIPQGGKQPIITAEELRQIVDGSFDLLIGICVSYWDGFGNARLSESWHTYNLPKSRWERVTIHQS
jgi:hypothetical protein